MSARRPRFRGPTFALPLPAYPRVPRDLLLAVLTSVLALEVGAAVVEKRSFALLPLAALAGLLLLVDGRARTLFLVFGGLFLLQSSDSLGNLKLLYLAGVVAAAAGASFRFAQDKGWLTRVFSWPLVRVSIMIFALLMVSYFVAHNHGIPRTDWLRDVAPYILFALCPIFALDAQAAFSGSALVRILVIAGSIATLSFATYWLDQRHIAHLPFSHFALSSFFLPGALFSYAITASLYGRQGRIRWLALALGVFSFAIVTGTRSTLLLVLVPVVAVFGARRDLSTRFVRTVVVAPIAAVLIGAGAYGVVSATHASTSIISKRISILKRTGTAYDASYTDRQAQARAAAHVFSDALVLGAGPGTYFSYTTTNGTKVSEFVIDTPLDFPAKFGIAGILVVVAIVSSYVSFLRSALRHRHPRTETVALIGYLVLAAAGAFLTNVIEDKGLSLGLLLLLALVFRMSDEPVNPDRPHQNPRFAATRL